MARYAYGEYTDSQNDFFGIVIHKMISHTIQNQNQHTLNISWHVTVMPKQFKPYFANVELFF